MSLHEFGHDLVFAHELGFELVNLLLLGIIESLALSAIVEGDVAVFKELFEPGVKLGGVDVGLVAKVGDGDLFEEMAFEDGDLIGAREMTTRLVHEKPPYRLC